MLRVKGPDLEVFVPISEVIKIPFLVMSIHYQSSKYMN